MFETPRLARSADALTNTFVSTAEAAESIANVAKELGQGTEELSGVYNDRMTILRLKSRKETIVEHAKLNAEVIGIEQAIKDGKLDEYLKAKEPPEKVAEVA